MPIFQAGRTEYEKYYGTFAVDFGYEYSYQTNNTYFAYYRVYEANADCDLVFDVRFLPNPYYIEELRPKNSVIIDEGLPL